MKILHNKIWSEKEHDLDTEKMLQESLQISPIISRVLCNRGIKTPDVGNSFLYPTLDALYNPLLLKDMDRAIERIIYAMSRNERICIFGDYDVDGITSISVLKKYFELMDYDPVDFYIPNRLDEGYGMSRVGIDRIHERKTDLIITVDCGITANEEALYCSELGIDLIITDHHTCQEEIPKALAVINPKRSDCEYPFDMLAGVGLAFKLVQGLFDEAMFAEHYDEFIDIVAFGTIADIAPISDENRIIAKFGLEKLRNSKTIGLRALILVSELDGKDITAGHIGFVLAPKINAAGRIGQPELGVELLTTKDSARATELAIELARLNKERQDIEARILEEVETYIEQNIKLEEKRILVIPGPNWHTGVIGIVASKISEKYYKPTIILEDDGVKAKGSARSVGDFNIFEAMNHCKDLFQKFGGHKQAAGVSLESGFVTAFDEKINAYAFDQMTELDLIPKIEIDAYLKSSDINHDLMDEMKLLEPHGVKNAKPLFGYEGLHVDSVKFIGKEKNHVKLLLHDDNRVYDALAFGKADKFAETAVNEKMDLVIALDLNKFRGVETIQFMINDFRAFNVENFKNLEFYNNYYKSLSSSIICNDINFDSKLDLLSIVKKSSKTHTDVDLFSRKLIIINTLPGLLEVMLNNFDDGFITDVMKDIYFGSVPNDCKSEIVYLANPVMSTLNMGNFDNVVVYDSPASLGWMEAVLKIFPFTRFRDVNLEGFRLHDNDIGTGIPNRYDLMDAYKLFTKKAEKPAEFIEICQELRFTRLKLELVIQIFRRLNLFKIKRHMDRLLITVCPKPESKIALDETVVYKRAHHYRKCYDQLLITYKEATKYD